MRIPTCTALKAEQLRNKIIKLASSDRYQANVMFIIQDSNSKLIDLFFATQFQFFPGIASAIELRQGSCFREILENGTEAFVSFIESYGRHDCNIVCPLAGTVVVL